MARARVSSGRRPAWTNHAGRWAVILLAGVLSTGCKSSTTNRYAMGSPCNPATSGQCADNLCLPLDSASGVCSKDCSADGFCPTEFACIDSGVHGLVCVRNIKCTVDDDCPSGHRCDWDATTSTGTGACYIKVSRGLCSPCTNDLQCPEGGSCFTVPSSGEVYCTTACGTGDSCTTGYACREVPILKNGVTTPTKQCVPDNDSGTCQGGRTICAPCKGDDECGGYADLCVRNVVSSEQFCGVVCDPARGAAGCPKGFNCLDLSGVDQGPYQCVPNSGSCTDYCDSSDEHVQVLQCGLGRQCDVTNKVCQPASDGRECSPCATDDDCRKAGHETNQCVVNDCATCASKNETFCAEPCPCAAADCTDGAKQCADHFGAGFACAKVGSGAFCVPQRGTCKSGLGRLGDTCPKGAVDCVTGVCLSYGKAALCSAVCTKDVDCADSHYRCCDKSGDFYDCSDAKRNAAKDGPSSGAGVCAPSGGLFGDDCRPGRPPCQSGTCLDIGTARLCTVPCGFGDSCPTDFVCRAASADLDAIVTCDNDSQCPANHQCDQSIHECRVKICFPDGGGLPGSDCTFGPAACSGRLCIKKPSGPVCSKQCNLDSTDPADACPSDWTCNNLTPVGQSAKIWACLPSGVTSN